MGSSASQLGLSESELKEWNEKYHVTPEQQKMVLTAFKKQKEKDGKMTKSAFIQMMFKVGLYFALLVEVFVELPCLCECAGVFLVLKLD